MADRSQELFLTNARRGARIEDLLTTVEMVLSEHADELAGERVDANLAELAWIYRELTGFDATKEATRAQ